VTLILNINQTLFDNMSSTLNKTKEINEEKQETKVKKYTFGEVFLLFVPLLKLYSGYFTNFQEVEQSLNEERKKNREMGQFLKQIKMKECKGQDINNLLIKPIQRIPR
jgi:hypothetical protein